jgi:hypothetical protein
MVQNAPKKSLTLRNFCEKIIFFEKIAKSKIALFDFFDLNKNYEINPANLKTFGCRNPQCVKKQNKKEKYFRHKWCSWRPVLGADFLCSPP